MLSLVQVEVIVKVTTKEIKLTNLPVNETQTAVIIILAKMYLDMFSPALESKSVFEVSLHAII